MVDASDEELQADLEPFERLRDAPMGMVAHVVYSAWDPERPASQSEIVIRDIIRGRIGFDNFLMSDDSNMNALTGSPGERAAACVLAGCDAALPCDGVMENNVDVARHIPELTAQAAERLARAMAQTFTFDDEMDFAEAVAKRDALLALV